MDMYDLIALMYPGWSLEDIRSLSLRERVNWIEKMKHRTRR